MEQPQRQHAVTPRLPPRRPAKPQSPPAAAGAQVWHPPIWYEIFVVGGLLTRFGNSLEERGIAYVLTFKIKRMACLTGHTISKRMRVSLENLRARYAWTTYAWETLVLTNPRDVLASNIHHCPSLSFLLAWRLTVLFWQRSTPASRPLVGRMR